LEIYGILHFSVSLMIMQGMCPTSGFSRIVVKHYYSYICHFEIFWQH